MYTESSIEEVKAKIDIVEVVEKYVTLKQRGDKYLGLCPFHKEKSPSFYVVKNARDIYYKCFGCGKGGDAIQFIEEHENTNFLGAIELLAQQYNITLVKEGSQNYIIPEWRNKTDISDKIVKWFEGRKISQKTITRLKITDGVESMPVADGKFEDMNCIHFNYFEEDKLTNVKYRGKNKTFKLHKGAKLILYNLDSIKGKKKVIWVEGEPDCCALVEAGYWNDEYGVISVPNGASKHKNNLIYIDNCIEYLKDIEEHILGLDNDSNGRKLRDEIANRFGKDKCKFIEWKDKKDANDVLIHYGIQGIIDCVSKPLKFPVEGVFTVNDFTYEIENIYNYGLDKGVSIKLSDFTLRFVRGYMTGIVGIPGHGKSEAVDEICLRLTKFHGWKGAFYSPENKPTELHYSKIARRLIGKPWEGENRLTKDEEAAVRSYLDKKIFFIKPEKDFTVQSILKAVRETQLRYGLDYFVIDAWNKLEHKDNDTNYVGKTLDELANFCEAFQLHLFLVVHPTKLERDKKTGLLPVPTLYNMAGSNNFNNKLDNGISIYLDREKNISTWHILKVKFGHWGWISSPEYKWDKNSGRYYKDGYPDFTNWITGQKNETPISSTELFDASPIADFDKDEYPF